MLEVNDLAYPKTYGKPKELYDLYRRLRDEKPIAYATPKGFRPFWVMTREADIRDIETHQDDYLAGERTVLLPEKVEAVYEKAYGDKNGVKCLTHVDGSHHKALRNVTKDWFSPRNLQEFRSRLTDIATEFVDHMENSGGRCDFAQDVAYLYPLRVVLTLMGVPREDELYVLGLTQRLLSPADKGVKGSLDHSCLSAYAQKSASKQQRDVFAEFGDYFDQLGDLRIKNPTSDLISAIVNCRIDGKPLEWREMISYYVIASTAGHDSTAASISGGLNALMDDPQEFEKLRSDLSLIPTAAMEMVRWTAPVKHFMRTPVQDVEWHGQVIKPGENIMLCFASACRDERAIENPDKFKVDRVSRPIHMGFGAGAHFCLGRFLATMEIEAFYTELLKRLDTIELVGSPTFIESSFVSGHKNLPIKFAFK